MDKKYVFTKEQCNLLIETAEKLNRWIYTESKDSQYYLSGFDSDGDIKNIIINYCKEELGITLVNVKVAILKYQEGGFFHKHQDVDPSSEFNKDFVYNINAILNDNYQGGEFMVDDKIFKRGVGEIYHYRSDRFHEVKSVTSGVRYVALFYIRKREIISQQTNLI